MSHELRTPLNSPADPLEAAGRQLRAEPDVGKGGRDRATIRRAGADLLTLINDILDLSKIESGTTSIDLQEIAFSQIQDDVERTFGHIAQDNNLDFIIRRDEDLPKALLTDPTRLLQILKNLLSNAFKFTTDGSVSSHLGTLREHDIDGIAGPAVAFSVTDTGIGIPPRQAQRHLRGLPASRHEHGAQVRRNGPGPRDQPRDRRAARRRDRVESVVGRGSTFTFYHPLERNVLGTVVQRTVAITGGVEERIVRPVPRTIADDRSHREIDDDRERIEADDRVLLIVEDDAVFARILLGLARDRGFKGLVAFSAAAGLALARRFRPDAITLDIGLPDVDGWSLLDEFKPDPATTDIPVHVISGDEQWQRALDFGAVAHLKKPVTEEALTQTFDSLLGFVGDGSKNLLLVEDDVTQLTAMIRLIESGEVAVTAVRNAAAALDALTQQQFDCVVVDLGLPDIPGDELIAQMRRTVAGASVPIIVYTGRDLTRQEERRLAELSETVIVKDAMSPERLLDETRYFLNQVESKLPSHKRTPFDIPSSPGSSLAGNRVLIIDDDARNIFALRSALEECAIEVLSAESGQEGIDSLERTANVDIALMDIMMPEMDGYETIRRIRANERFADLPIIALTAKAMNGDRESCIAAGASEYISKPVDIDQLIALLRVWLNR